MRMLLINQNPVVSKLAGLSAQKSGVEIVEKPSLEALEEESGGEVFDVLFIDDAKLEEADAKRLKALSGARKVGLIYADDDSKARGFDYYLKKPFLPTEMVDLLSEIKEELLLPEMEESIETGEVEREAEEAETAEPLEAEEASGETPVGEPESGSMERAEETTTEEDFSSLLEDIDMGAETEDHAPKEAEETAEEEDFDALLQSLEEEKTEEPATEVETSNPEEASSEEGGQPIVEEPSKETATEVSEMVERPEAEDREGVDFDTLLEEIDTKEVSEVSQNEGSEPVEEEDFDALLADLESEGEEEETISLPEPEEEVAGVLDEEMVSEVKELLEEGHEGKEVEEKAGSAMLETVEEAVEEPSLAKESLEEEPSEKEIEEAFYLEELTGEETPVETPEAEAEEELLPDYLAFEAEEAPEISPVSEEGDEFEGIDEAELGALLGEEIGDDLAAIEGTSPETASVDQVVPEPEGDVKSAETELVTKLLGMDPEAVRKLLSGAQITINISFPKED